MFLDSTLREFAIQGAQLYSAERHPAPECYAGTRTTIIDEILQWSRGELEEELLWVYGPAGAGKTAIAQTVGQSIKPEVFMAGFFFSRPRKHNDPARFWPSICYQMTRRNGALDDYIHGFYGNTNWSVLKKSIPNQFHELIWIPLSTHPLEGSPRIIMVDGLDECEGEEEQSEIVRCILGVLRTPGVHLGIRWLIISRPEPHLKHVFERAESEGLCSTKEVPIDDLETQADIQVYLKAEFARIANTHLGILVAEEIWPKQSDLEKIFHAAFGLFIFAVTIVKFVGDPVSRDPVSRLQLVIGVIDGSPLPPGTSHPLASIDNLYRELIKRTPPNLLTTTLRVLGVCIVCPPLPVAYFAHLLALRLEELYDALLALHSVINIPSKAKASQESLRFFHASFPDFLMNSERSDNLVQDVTLHRLCLAETCFRMLSHSEVSYVGDIPGSLFELHEDDDSDDSDDWDVGDDNDNGSDGDDGGNIGGNGSDVNDNDDEAEKAFPSPLSTACVVLTFASTHVWEIFTRIHNPTPSFLRRTVGSFDFRLLQFACESIPSQGFIEFLQWLDRNVCSIL